MMYPPLMMAVATRHNRRKIVAIGPETVQPDHSRINRFIGAGFAGYGRQQQGHDFPER
jgi:hypothetical protein